MPDSTLTDPLGRTYILRESTWRVHILAGHSDLTNHRALVEQAVTSPSSIYISNSNPNCRIFYGAGPRPNVSVAVIGDVLLGIIKTAYLVKKTSGARLEWHL